jgi:hypothetical protein
MSRRISGQVSNWDKQTVFPSSNPTSIYANRSDRWYPPIGPTGAIQASSASNANRICFWLYAVQRPLTVNRIGTYCWTGEAGSLLRFGLYNVGLTGLPTSLIADYGTVSGATAGGKTASGSTVVNGIFALACATSNHTSVRWSVTPGSQYIFGDGSLALNRPGFFQFESGTDHSAGLPSAAPTVSIGDTVTGPPQIVGLVEFT